MTTTVIERKTSMRPEKIMQLIVEFETKIEALESMITGRNKVNAIVSDNSRSAIKVLLPEKEAGKLAALEEEAKNPITRKIDIKLLRIDNILGLIKAGIKEHQKSIAWLNKQLELSEN